jgi:hypothetical protein
MMLPASTVRHAVPGRIRMPVSGMRGDETGSRGFATASARRPELPRVAGSRRTVTILPRGRDHAARGLAPLARDAGWREPPRMGDRDGS